MTESGDVAELTRKLYNLEIDGPDTFKPGLPYHGLVSQGNCYIFFLYLTDIK